MYQLPPAPPPIVNVYCHAEQASNELPYTKSHKNHIYQLVRLADGGSIYYKDGRVTRKDVINPHRAKCDGYTFGDMTIRYNRRMQRSTYVPWDR
jgi:hypothetical protein